MAKSRKRKRKKPQVKRPGVMLKHAAVEVHVDPSMEEAVPKIEQPAGKDITYAIGDLITHWAQMEEHLNDLLVAIMDYNGNVTPLSDIKDFKRRWERLKDETKLAFDQHPELISEIHKISSDIGKCKPVRDNICHGRLSFGLGGTPQVTVTAPPKDEDKSRAGDENGGPKEIEYTIYSLRDAKSQARKATGRLYRMLLRGYAQPPASSESISFLRTVLGMGS